MNETIQAMMERISKLEGALKSLCDKYDADEPMTDDIEYAKILLMRAND
jgi:hypothetical protein